MDNEIDYIQIVYLDGKIEVRDHENLHHSIDDQPAIIYPNGDKYYYRHGKIHRDDDKPAIEHHNGYKEWIMEGVTHRMLGPARIYSDGSVEYWKDNYLHRFDGPAIITADNHMEWFIHGVRHNVDNPAIKFANGDMMWYTRGRLMKYVCKNIYKLSNNPVIQEMFMNDIKEYENNLLRDPRPCKRYRY